MRSAEFYASLIRLHSVDGLGNRTLLKLFTELRSVDNILNKVDLLIRQGKAWRFGLDTQMAKTLAQEVIEKDVRILTINDSSYPDRLRTLYDPPAILYARGNLNLLKEKTVGIVGTRRYSDYGKRVTIRFSNHFVRSNLTVVSGLAMGIDAIAHESVTLQKGNTIAVLGSGVDLPTPVQNAYLYNEIIHSSGLILSEMPIASLPTTYSFPRRNRIIAGLSDALLVVEAGSSSGALITARESLELGKDVFAVPGEIDSHCSSGTNLLIQQGAQIALRPEDIHETLSVTSQSPETLSQLITDQLQSQIFSMIAQRTISIEELVDHTNCSIDEVLRAVSELEIRDFICRTNGEYFSIK